MKFSEAIRLGAMATEQGFYGRSVTNPDAPCAIGSALLAIGKLVTDVESPIRASIESFRRIKSEWPYMHAAGRCPVCACQEISLVSVVWHLNDFHRWTREQIADWVQTIEPCESAEHEAVTTVAHSAPECHLHVAGRTHDAH